jgi:hypothetical protein
MSMSDEYRIHISRLDYLNERFAKLNRKASKLGCESITATILREETETDKEGIVDVFKIITIQGIAPKLNGWEFLGTIDFSEHGNIIRKVNSDITIPEYFRSIQIHCDHCNSNRFRKNTFIVHNLDTNEYKQVGRQCLKDFLGHKSPEAVANWIEWLGKLSEELEEEKNYHNNLPREERDINLITYLEYVSASIKVHGWLSKGKARELYEQEEITKQPTSEIAINEMFPIRPQDREIYPDSTDIELAKNAIEWAKNIQDTSNDYLYTISVIAKNGYTNYKELGFSASIVSSYTREIEKQLKREQEQKQRGQMKHIGQIGEKILLDLTVFGVHYFDSQYGARILINFNDSEGNSLTWWTSDNCKNSDLKQGQTYKIQGTVKEHAYYKNFPQTVLTRCKIK